MLQVVLLVVALYGFLASIDLMSMAFKGLGGGFAEGLFNLASDPLAGLLIGLLVTSLVQSSSFTTSLAVGLVAAGTLPLRLAVPIVMGANIGTTVTNTIVSLGHLGSRKEFARAFAAGTVHDFFNVLAVLVLFPLELLFHPIERAAQMLETLFAGIGGIQMISPLKAVIRPVTGALADLRPDTGILADPSTFSLVLLVAALVVLFMSLSQIVRVMRRLVMTRVEGLFDRVLFRNDRAGFLLGWALTSVVQSSSVTTSLVVPLVGTGMLSVRRIFPYTLGANLGTTVTALLASFAIGKPEALVVAFAHLTFNVFGTVIFYPARVLPIRAAIWTGRLAARSRKSGITVVLVYILLHLFPVLYLLKRVH
jgi:sodium-dependent phosphate cotransporter